MKNKDYYGYVVFEDGTIISKMKGTSMSSHDNGRGYLILNLRIGGKSRIKGVHRVVAEAFIPNPDNLSDVDHIDGDMRNNHVSNLRWLTHGDNIKHCYSLNNRSATGENNARCDTTEETVLEICRMLQNGERVCNIRDKVGVPYSRISSIKSRKNWISVSKDFSW